MTMPDSGYAARLEIDYQEPLDRLSTAFRIFWAIPILIVLGALGGSGGSFDTDDGTTMAAGAAGVVVIPLVLMIVFRQKYPRWWFDWNLALTRFSTRVVSYLALMTDKYPSTDEEQNVRLDLDYPDAATDLNRWMPLVKWLLAIPHFIVLFFLAIAAFVVVIIAWFAILFTGKYPAGLFGFVLGVMRWGLRVQAYAILLITDKYPPFSLQ
ncbi:MAG: DUF4389 domain-containing protein [Tepidiformaceae bacterium]